MFKLNKRHTRFGLEASQGWRSLTKASQSRASLGRLRIVSATRRNGHADTLLQKITTHLGARKGPRGGTKWCRLAKKENDGCRCRAQRREKCKSGARLSRKKTSNKFFDFSRVSSCRCNSLESQLAESARRALALTTTYLEYSARVWAARAWASFCSG